MHRGAFRSKCQWAWCVQVEAARRKAGRRPVAVARSRNPYPDFGQVPHARMVCRALIAAQQSPRTEVAPPASALISAYICASQATKSGLPGSADCSASSPIPRILALIAVVKLRPVSHRGWIFPVRWSCRSMKPGRMIHGTLTGESAAPCSAAELVARYDTHRAWQVRAERCQIEVAPWPPRRKKATSSFAYPSRAGTLPPSAERFGRKVAVGADVRVRHERPPSSFNIPRCRVQPCPAEDVNVRDQTLKREYSVGGHEAHGFALFKRGSQMSLVARGLLGHRKRIRMTMTISHSPAQEFK